jgi:3-oxoadipate enol-lactonase
MSAVHTTDDGCRLAYEVSGPETAPVLLLSNSLGTDRTLWDAQLAAFARTYRVVRYDTRGHGASDAPLGDYSIERLGRDVLSLLDVEGIARASVCGVSIGGLTALWLGIHAPDRIDRLVLANTAARIGSRELWDERTRLVRTEGLAALADATMARWFTAAFREAQPATVARVRATLLTVPVAGYLGCCVALGEADLHDAAVMVQAPTLVVTGRHDVATPPADGQALAAAIPGARHVEFEAAHISNLECADEFTEAVLSFLQSGRDAD